MKYKKILLKLSGEVFEGEKNYGMDFKKILEFAKEIKDVSKSGVKIGIVIGGGNIWRFRDFSNVDFLERTDSDMLGMMATVMNGVVLSSALKKCGVRSRVMSSFPCESLCETYNIARSKKYMEDGEVLIFAGGTGSPFFTTDSASALRALEMNCDVLMKATKVDFVYDKDPVKYKDAKKFKSLQFSDVVKMKLGVMDLTCASLLDEGSIPMLVFNLTKKGNIKKAVEGSDIGTLISSK
jgi:uridylate kinase